MKVVAFNCSPKSEGNTAHMIRTVLDVLESHGIETEMVQVGGNDLHGCRACMGCARNKDMRCVLDDDLLNTCIAKMVEADGIIIGSPTYFSDLTTEAKALIDRAGYVTRSNGMALRHKVGAAVTAVRRAGGICTFDSINHFFSINDMYTVGSSYWNMSLARVPGDYEQDAEGVATMRDLGESMAHILVKLNG
ncbi:MAG: flavodoxin family protein [Candidatus Methanomethylophilaceae archaeon]|nr:flavodoxin family protein [Candidatus Methanomethylophilaceae archaeon]